MTKTNKFIAERVFWLIKCWSNASNATFDQIQKIFTYKRSETLRWSGNILHFISAYFHRNLLQNKTFEAAF